MTEITVLTNASVRTMERAAPLAEAIAVQGERIVTVGRLVDMPDGQRVDLGGRLVLPAFSESHIHLMSWALSLDAVPLDGVASREAAVQAVADRVAQTPSGEWITGWGWNHNVWDTGLPSRTDLDRVAPDHPVVLTRKDGHMIWANSLALKVAGVTSETPDPTGGAVYRDADGAPNGLLVENATALVYGSVPRPDSARRRASLARAFPRLHRMGLVGGHEMGYMEAHGLWEDYKGLAAEGKLPWRIAMWMPKHSLDDMIAAGMKSGDGDHNLRVGGLKVFMDGTLGSQTADMLADFEGQPGNRGIVTTEVEEFRDLATRGAAAGISCAVHAIGDAANRKTLDVFAEVARQDFRSLRDCGSLPPLRHRIEHVQVIHPEDLPRLAQLGIVASVQPIHATSDMLVADKFWGERARYAYAFCSLLSCGTKLAFGSDAPVETPDVMVGIHAAVTRQRADGTPPGGWYPQERVSVEEALHAYTLGAAYVTGEEAVKGSLAPGKLADLVVLDQDIFAIDPTEILNTKVDATMLGGDWVFNEGLG